MNQASADPLGAVERWRGQAAEQRSRLVESVREEVRARGFTRVVLGLSGGLDSTTAATLCVEALGAENVLAVLMPHRASSQAVLALAQGVVSRLGMTSRRVNMSPVVDAYFANFPDANRFRRGLCLAWERVGVLVDLGHHYGACVVQAMNRSDRLLSYGDAHLELTASLKPLAGLYKTQVTMLAEALDVMPEVRQRRASLEYWAGQTDESDLGHPYAAIDPLLYSLVDCGRAPAEIVAQGVTRGLVEWGEKRLEVWRALQGLSRRAAQPQP